MFIFIKDFVTDEIDDFTNILITVIDSMGKLEQPRRFDRKTNYDNREWNQDGYFKNHQTQKLNGSKMWIRMTINLIDFT